MPAFLFSFKLSTCIRHTKYKGRRKDGKSNNNFCTLSAGQESLVSRSQMDMIIKRPMGRVNLIDRWVEPCISLTSLRLLHNQNLHIGRSFFLSSHRKLVLLFLIKHYFAAWSGFNGRTVEQPVSTAGYCYWGAGFTVKTSPSHMVISTLWQGRCMNGFSINQACTSLHSPGIPFPLLD